MSLAPEPKHIGLVGPLGSGLGGSPGRGGSRSTFGDLHAGPYPLPIGPRRPTLIAHYPATRDTHAAAPAATTPPPRLFSCCSRPAGDLPALNAPTQPLQERKQKLIIPTGCHNQNIQHQPTTRQHGRRTQTRSRRPCICPPPVGSPKIFTRIEMWPPHAPAFPSPRRLNLPGWPPMRTPSFPPVRQIPPGCAPPIYPPHPLPGLADSTRM